MLYNLMSENSENFNADKYFSDFKNEMGLPSNESSENEGNNFIILNIIPETLLNEPLSNLNKINGIGDNKNLCKSNIIGEDSTSLLDKNKINENENENENNNSTGPSSNENESSNIEKIAQNLNNEEKVNNEKKPKFKSEITTSIKASYWRFDYAKKHWKTKISQNLTDCINDKISNSDLPNEYKNKIHKPNSKLFTANVNEGDNYVFLQKNNITILTIGKENNKKPKDNDENISKIYEYFEKIGYNNLSDKMIEIKNLLEMTYENFIKKFYDSDEFINFKNEENTMFYDEGTKKQEGFAISENYGLIKIFGRKRKREENIWIDFI